MGGALQGGRGGVAPEAFVFSLDPAGDTSLKPSSVTQQYGRMAGRMGIETHLHNLRHYSATELIPAGVDVRTVAGRLGHGGGGTTTLRVYAAWVAEADQRAAQGLTARLPAMPAARRGGAGRGRTPGRRTSGWPPSCAAAFGGELSVGSSSSDRQAARY